MKNKKKKKSAFKKAVGKLHLWLGLASGIVVFIVAVTGCIYVFHDEIKDIVFDYRKVEVENSPYVLPSQLKKISLQHFPEMTTAMIAFAGKDRPAFIYGLEEGEEYYAYFNPYTGELLHRGNVTEGFFETVLNLHMYLLLPKEIGKQVVGISTLIFVFMLVSGIVLWWPKKKKNLKQRLKIKFNAKWRRVNYDWHNVTGIYVSLLALIIAITGLNFSYEWMHEGIYLVGNLGKTYPEEEAFPAVDKRERGNIPAIDVAISKAFENNPENEMFFVWDQGKNLPVITGSYPKSLHYHGQTNLFFHPETGELLKENLYQNKSAGMKLQEMSYGIHTGQFFGLTGKIIAFFASLFVAALPVTGFMIWWGRKKKEKK